MKEVQSQPLLTIGVLTLNEEKRIERCLKSARFADQIVVVDSGSTDQTTALAQKMGAEVYVYDDWQGFSVQRNRVLQHAKGKYIFFLDADEFLEGAGVEEIKKIVSSGENAVWKIHWKMIAFGEVLHHLKSTSYVERLFLRENITAFQGVVHEQAMLVNQNVPRYVIKHPVLHVSRESIRSSLEKMTQYAMLGAYKRAQKNKKGGILRGFFSGLNIFIRLYLFDRGFLCGGAGFLYAFFHALEAFFRYVALKYDKDTLVSDIKRL